MSVSLMAQFLLSSEVLTQITWPRMQASTRHYSFPHIYCLCTTAIEPSRPVNVLCLQWWGKSAKQSWTVTVCGKTVFVVLYLKRHFSSSACSYVNLTQQLSCVFEGWIHQNHKPKPVSSCNPSGSFFSFFNVPMFWDICLWDFYLIMWFFSPTFLPSR